MLGQIWFCLFKCQILPHWHFWNYIMTQQKIEHKSLMKEKMTKNIMRSKLSHWKLKYTHAEKIANKQTCFQNFDNRYKFLNLIMFIHYLTLSQMKIASKHHSVRVCLLHELYWVIHSCVPPSLSFALSSTENGVSRWAHLPLCSGDDVHPRSGRAGRLSCA